MGLFSSPGKNQQDADDDLDVPVKPRRSRRSQAQEDEPIDPMLPEKQRARRRLIGATALVLAAIIGLPMIFDADPDKPLPSDIEPQIPDRIAPVSENVTPPAVVQPAPKPAAPASAAKTDDLVPPASPAADIPAKSKTSSDGIDKAAADKKADPKAAAGDDNAREKPRKYVLQVAAVNSKAKAEELQNRLKQSGIKAYSQKITTRDGDRFRVRVGPFASREEAERMHERVKKTGLNGSVLSL